METAIKHEVRPKPLCQNCQPIVDWALRSGNVAGHEELPWHPSPAALAHSMQHSGFPFCTLLRNHIRPVYFRRESADCCFYVHLKREPSSTRLSLVANETGRGDQLVWAIDGDIDKANFWLVNPDTELGQRPIWQCGQPIFEGRIVTVKNWLAECHRLGHDHSLCKPPGSLRLPKRLLHLQATGTTDSLKLVVTDRLHPATRYTTLSHCWGPPSARSPLKTTWSSITDFQKEILYNWLPRNFKDAVTFTRMLNIDYIWIDSLCIIQDDTQDWEVESAKMAGYYQGSYLTIAAAASADCHGGLIQDSDPAQYLSPWAVASHSGRTVLMRKTTMTDRSLHKNYNSNSGSYPIVTRGWVLQEQVLSPRTVFCTGSKQLLWQCRSLFASEDGLIHRPEFCSLGNLPQRFDLSDEKSAHQVRWFWVYDYSKRELAYSTDRAPAVAGLVDYYKSQTGHTLLLGLWKESLCYNLFWTPSRFHRSDSLPDRDPNRFPTWSWLSPLILWDPKPESIVLGPTVHEHGSYTTQLAVVSAEVVWQAAPFTSKLQGAKLQVRGLVREAMLG
ncbi:hypothetical protein VTI74DRAFT_3474 [Chaetomium olivicolor]